MAAPSGTVWGSIVGGYGRIGIATSLTNTNTQTTVSVEVWFWSKYSVSDSSNTLYYDILASAGSATTSKGSVAVKTEIDGGAGWGTGNQQKLATYTHTYNRGTSASTKYLRARLINIDRVGGEMTAATSVSIPTLPSYPVSYNANGGTGAPASQTKWHGTDLKLSSTKPTRTGYTFQGWGTSTSDTTVDYAPGASYTANSDIVLCAIWKANTYTVSYNANGGSGAPSNQTKTYGVALTLSSTKPTRPNYEFLGWSTDANATVVLYYPGYSYTANQSTVLYAVWKLSYAKPRITNLSVSRCDDDGSDNENGTYALVSFAWACDKTVKSISVKFEPETGDALTYPITGTGTNGTVLVYLGDGEFDTEMTYAVTVIIEDELDSSHAFTTLPGTKFAIDFRADGKGAAFGKPAELDDVLDIGYKTRFFGGLLPVVLDPGTDLNTVRTPNTYTGANISSYEYVNCPVTSGTFTLIVESCGESGQVRQTYISCSKITPERFVRFYYQSSWGDWFWAGTEEYVLYEDSLGGSTGTITLSASAANYRYIEIYFTDNNGKSGGYTKVWSPQGRTVCLNIVETSSTTSVIYRQTMYTISGTSMTPATDKAGYLQFNPSTKTITNSPIGTNYIKIVRVIGRA